MKFLQSIFEEKGWERISPGFEGKRDTRFKLKWCERASDFSFREFKERRQMIGRNPKISCIGNKLQLRKTLQDYERRRMGTVHDVIHAY